MSNFKNDSFLWYNVGHWKDLGLAVPNWGNDEQSQNANIRYLTTVMGRSLQNIMFHDDARLTVPPSINTLIRLHKLCTRARDILASRAIPANVPNMESEHANPAPEVHMVYPTPYFKVRNIWLKDYAALILTAITDMVQNQENAKPIEISTRFAATAGQYIKRVYRRMAIELFQVPLSLADADDFTLTSEQLNSYDPTKWFTSTEMTDIVPLIGQEPTEDDLAPLTAGIPVTMIPNLGRWPAAVIESGASANENTGTGSSFEPNPGA